MKKTLIILVCLLTTVGMNAQRTTGSEILDAMLEGIEEVSLSIEKEFLSYGIDCKANLYFDSSTNEIVYCYEFFDENIFSNFDVSNGAKGSIRGMIGSVLNQDPTGETLKQLISAFEETKCNMRLQIKYIDVNDEIHNKDKLIKPSDIKKMVSALL